MKEIKRNLDGSVNIVNPDKYYVAKTVWRDMNKTNYFILTNESSRYGFRSHKFSTRIIFDLIRATDH